MLSIQTNFDDNMSPVTEYAWDIYEDDEENNNYKPVLWFSKINKQNNYRGYADNYNNELNITNIYNHIIILKEKMKLTNKKYDNSIIDIIYDHEILYNKNTSIKCELKKLINDILLIEKLID